jgi:hypothetical protein
MQFISIPSFDLLTNAILRNFLNFLFCFGPYTKPCELQITFICCPSNIGLLLFVQILFLKRLSPLNMPVIGILNQKALVVSIATMDLSNTFLTRNMKVLVYGVWDGQSQNIYPFLRRAILR